MGTTLPPASGAPADGGGSGVEHPPDTGAGTGSSPGPSAPDAGTGPAPSAPGAGSSPGPSAPDAAPPAPAAPPAKGAAVGMRRPRPIFLVVGLLLALGMTIGLVIGLMTVGSSTGSGHEAVPKFTLPRVGGPGKVGVPLDGGTNGHPAIVLFFASWCTPCQKEIPALSRVYDRQHAQKSKLDAVSVIGVDGSDPTKSALAFMTKSKVTFPVGADAVYAVTQGKFGFTGLPESVFVNGNGTIAYVHYGAISTTQFVSWERKLLASA